MKLLDFYKDFPNEEACQAHFKSNRDKEGVICKECCGEEHWWLKSKSMYQCKNCDRRMSLRSGTVMENSKLPFLFWYVAMHLMTASKRNVSALEVQKQVGHTYYEPIWAMMHKLRRAMANRDEKHQLTGEIELDEAFFVVNDPRDPDQPIKRGAGSERQAKVVAMAESTPVEESKKGRKKYRCGYFKMIAIEDLKAETINQQAKNGVTEESQLRTDNSKSHKGLHKLVKKHDPITLPGKEGCKILPWVHTSISNAKAMLLATYHGISEGYIQNYLSEFCYKLNRRYHGFRLFDRLVVAATYHWNQ
jgi:ISXO2-like transposase domain